MTISMIICHTIMSQTYVGGKLLNQWKLQGPKRKYLRLQKTKSLQNSWEILKKLNRLVTDMFKNLFGHDLLVFFSPAELIDVRIWKDYIVKINKKCFATSEYERV